MAFLDLERAFVPYLKKGEVNDDLGKTKYFPKGGTDGEEPQIA